MHFNIALILAALCFAAPLHAEGTKAASTPQDGGKPLYTVVDGNKVDDDTLKGFRTWRAAACDRCHGANQEGLVGPSLIESLKILTKEEFITTVIEGRLVSEVRR